MSTTETRMSFTEAYVTAEHFSDEIRPYCERLVIAGSLRRRSADVGDIEIVAVPKVEVSDSLDMFGESVGSERIDLLDLRLTMQLDRGVVQRRATNGHSAWGMKYKRLSFEGAPFDLFCCDAERFGLILAIRTGPAGFSNALVTNKGSRTRDGRPGMLPTTMRVVEGWLTYRVSGQRIAVPTEEAFFETIGLPYVEPQNRD